MGKLTKKIKELLTGVAVFGFLNGETLPVSAENRDIPDSRPRKEQSNHKPFYEENADPEDVKSFQAIRRLLSQEKKYTAKLSENVAREVWGQALEMRENNQNYVEFVDTKLKFSLGKKYSEKAQQALHRQIDPDQLWTKYPYVPTAEDFAKWELQKKYNKESQKNDFRLKQKFEYLHKPLPFEPSIAAEMSMRDTNGMAELNRNFEDKQAYMEKFFGAKTLSQLSKKPAATQQNISKVTPPVVKPQKKSSQNSTLVTWSRVAVDSAENANVKQTASSPRFVTVQLPVLKEKKKKGVLECQLPQSDKENKTYTSVPQIKDQALPRDTVVVMRDAVVPAVIAKNNNLPSAHREAHASVLASPELIDYNKKNPVFSQKVFEEAFLLVMRADIIRGTEYYKQLTPANYRLKYDEFMQGVNVFKLEGMNEYVLQNARQTNTYTISCPEERKNYYYEQIEAYGGIKDYVKELKPFSPVFKQIPLETQKTR